MTTPHAETPGAAELTAEQKNTARSIGEAWVHTRDEDAYRIFAAALTAARAAGFADGRDAAVAVCRERVNLHDANVNKCIIGSKQFTAHSCYANEAEACADAIAALSPPAPAAGSGDGEA